MNTQVVPTKGNLIGSKKSLELAKVGFDLLDKKRNILIRELMTLIDHANEIQQTIDVSYSKAYLALQEANMTLGICEELASTVPVDESLRLSYRSVMGVEIPIVFIEESKMNSIPFGIVSSNSVLDKAYKLFLEVKQKTAELSEVENSVYRLAKSIKKTQKRANALKNIIIPRFEKIVKFINNVLDEKEREDFSRLKVIKKQKE
ncbi:MAG: V-type ATP synthase subunit D [Oscillospiraceae bacterium]|nr:V-type ATP synthase subunit D [Oscillospiraceae bacterium]